MSETGEAAFFLVVESGPQRDARCRLLAGRHIVGSDLDSDVVVCGASIAPGHFALEYGAGAVRLLALGGMIDLVDRALPPGCSAMCRDAMRFNAGGVAFRLELPPAGTSPKRAHRPRLAVLAGVAAAMFAMAIGLVAVARGAAIENDAAPRAAGVVLAVARAVQPAAGAPALAEIRTRLDQAGLETIALAAAADGSIEASGAIGPAQLAQWRSMQRWFDARFGDRAVLVDAVVVEAQQSPLAIQAVWAGANPYVIDGSGQKLFAGAILHGGWVIETISSERVLIGRAGETLAVRF